MKRIIEPAVNVDERAGFFLPNHFPIAKLRIERIILVRRIVIAKTLIFVVYKLSDSVDFIF